MDNSNISIWVHGKKEPTSPNSLFRLFLTVYVQSTFCLLCTVIQPYIWLTVRRNLPFWNPKWKVRQEVAAVIPTGKPLYIKACLIHNTVFLTDLSCAAHTAWPSGQCCATQIWWLQGKLRWLLVKEELQAAPIQCRWLFLLHGLAFIWQCCKKFSWEHCFCLTVKMMNRDVFL